MSVSALGKDWPGTFPWEFADAQFKSIAIRYANDGEQAQDVPLSACPGDTEVLQRPDLTVDDPCGPDNAAYVNIPTSPDYDISVDPVDGSVESTAHTGFVFDGGEPVISYDPPVDSGTACPVARAVVACVYPDSARVVAGVPLGTITILDELTAIANGFLGVFPFDYTSGTDTVSVLAYVQPGQTAADFDALEMCGEVGGICEDASTDPGAVDGDGVPCTPTEPTQPTQPGAPSEPGEVGGIVTTAALPDTGGPAGFLLPLGALLVLLGAGMVMVRRPHSA
ncbi:hypothetical protein G5V59_17800 [Nocardioides sp. W3-2-3]|uniref:hypothetical protein n=1 Tax=Nocardioides convexus TaxID=2712224 RepID=UPI0024184AD8|nr:hypothetical protein [Nocardioides convexus]NHA01107.1 hypothetical protein [Nocardioides convexus]